MGLYRVTGPTPVYDVAPGGLLDRDLDPAEEHDLVSTGRLAIEPARYRVVGTATVADVAPGGVATLALTRPQRDALIAAGHLDPIPDKPKKEKT